MMEHSVHILYDYHNVIQREGDKANRHILIHCPNLLRVTTYLPTYTPHSTRWQPHPSHCHSHKQVSHSAVDSTSCTQ